MNFPDNLKYTKDHEWVRVEGNTAVIGITDFAQSELGDIVYVEVETEGEELAKDTQLRKMNGNRGSKHFLYINRTFFGLYNLLHDLKARVHTRHFEKYLPTSK